MVPVLVITALQNALPVVSRVYIAELSAVLQMAPLSGSDQTPAFPAVASKTQLWTRRSLRW